MNKNNLYFLNVWSKIIISAIPMVLILFFGLFMSESRTTFSFNLVAIISAMVLAFLCRKMVMKKQKNDVDRYFKNETSEQLLNYFDNIYKKRNSKMPDKDAALAYTKSVICCYYGEFDKAKGFMQEVNWEKRSPNIQSLELSLRALICYLETQNYREGLRLSIISQQLGAVSNKVPGSEKSQKFYETYIQIGEILNGDIDNSVINDLEQEFDDSPILIKLLIGFSLSKAYNQINMPEKATEKLDYCKKAAPYCVPLFN